MGTRLMEVRCCCDAGKLLGYLPIPEINAWPGARVQFTGFGARVQFTGFGARPAIEKYSVLLLEVGEIPIAGDMHLALKSMDHPIEQLRKLRGWVDADAERETPFCAS